MIFLFCAWEAEQKGKYVSAASRLLGFKSQICQMLVSAVVVAVAAAHVDRALPS